MPEEKEQTVEKKHNSVHGWRLVGITLLGTILYGTLSWITNFTPIGGAFEGQLRPGVAIPIVFGFLYGPWVGFLSGFLGNLGLDYLTGSVSYPPDPATGNLIRDFFAAYFLNWQIGNGLFGLIPGLWSRFYQRYDRIWDLVVATVITAVAIFIGTAFASFTDILIYDYVDFDFALNQELIPISQINLINGLLLVPILLFNITHLDYRALPSIRSGLMRRLLIALLMSAALPVVLLGLFLIQQTTVDVSESTALMLKLSVTIVLTLLFTVVNALLVAQTVSTPLLRLANAARLVEEEKLTQEDIDQIRSMSGNDEITQLGHVFASMAKQVIIREKRLQRQVQELRIEIDRVRQEQSVSEITDSEYFQDLRQKVNELRNRQRTPKPSSEPSALTTTEQPTDSASS